MKAVRFNEFGGPEKLHIVEVPMPKVSKGKILVRVKAAGLNPGESMIREGLFEDFFPTKLPCGEGSDFAGIVQQIGEDVVSFAIGEEVVGYTDNRASHAEFVLADADKLVHKPKDISWEVGGSLYVAGNTAIASVEAVDVKAGDVVVITGASGSVGSIACQLALLRGARVVGIADQRYHKWLQARGVETVDYHGDVKSELQKLPNTIDAFIDTVGNGYVKIAVDLGVNPYRINTTIDFQAAQAYGVQSKGSTGANGKHSLQTLLQYIDRNELQVPIARTFSIDQVAEAYKYMEQKHELGKVVLNV